MKEPKVILEDDFYIEVEVPEGKSEEYNLEGYTYCGGGQSFDNPPKYFEYYYKAKRKLEGRE